MLGGCSLSLRTHTLDEALPRVLDDRTLLPLIESVTVTRASDGASVTLTGTEVEPLMLCFENILCTRKKETVTGSVYTVSFVMTDPAASFPPLRIAAVQGSTATVFGIGEYRYEPINMTADITYLESLFS